MRQITTEEFKKVEDELDMLKLLHISPFSPPKKQWMQRTCKQQHKKTGNLGVSAVNWLRLAETAR